jgi:hypothetical protein
MSAAQIRHRLETQRDRVREHSSQWVNQRITRGIQSNLERCLHEGRDAIVARLAELDREWDIDRVLMANFAVLGGATYATALEREAHGSIFSRRRSSLFYVVGAQFGFLLMHAVIGWCPPAAVWRRFGFRTKAEIDVERSALLEALAADNSHETVRQEPPNSVKAAQQVVS